MHNPVAQIIAEKGWCVADGATGANFFDRGLEAGYPPDLCVLSGQKKCFGFTAPF